MELPCRRHERGTTSYWKPAAGELAILMRGGTIAFTHFGPGHPVVGMGVEDPAAAPGPGWDEEEWERGFMSSLATLMRLHGIRSIQIESSKDFHYPYVLERCPSPGPAGCAVQNELQTDDPG